MGAGTPLVAGPAEHGSRESFLAELGGIPGREWAATEAPRPEDPDRVPLWNWGPKTMYGMVFGTQFQSGTVTGI